MALTLPVWPSSTLRHDPVAASHTRTVLSQEADATSWPSGEKATVLTLPVWPSSTLQHDPLAASHTRTVLSEEADATSWPSGEKAMALTLPVWPSSTLQQPSQSSSRFDNDLIHCSNSSTKAFRTILASGANIRADEYIYRGASWSICWNRRVNRLASWRNTERALFDVCIAR